MSEPTVFTLAICLFPVVTASDFVGPLELFSFLYPETLATGLFGTSSYAIKPTFLSIDKNPVRTSSAFTIVPTKTYEETKSEQYDILLVPGGEFMLFVRFGLF